MEVDIKVPSLGESVTEATVAKWYKKEGEPVARDELLVELETDKVTLEVTAPAEGIIAKQVAKEGDTVKVGALLGTLKEGASPAPAKAAPQPAAPVAPPVVAEDKPLSPAVRKMVAENPVSPDQISGSGKGGRLTKGDVLEAINQTPSQGAAPLERKEERVRMTRLRKTIADRLKESQQTAAILTTFNEIDMSAVIALRSRYKDVFEKRHAVKLGFMSFFVRAVIAALKEIPTVNAEIQGDDIVYKNYYHIGVAVGTEQGLVVPVVRDADGLSLAQIEQTIAGLGKKAREGKLAVSDLSGGTFTISNGGIYGSLLSTPIINPPQSGILGMHKIQDRPMVVNGAIEIRPMMYVALSYDHRLVDGREAVTFLVRVKECIEAPERLLMDL